MLPNENKGLLSKPFIVPPRQINKFIFLGNKWNLSPSTLKRLNIEYILSLRLQPSRLGSDFTILHCPMDDFGRTDLTGLFDKLFNFLEEAKAKNKKVLVHCEGGINRAPTICMAYLVSHEGYTLKEAYEYIKNIQPKVAPREDYIKQLQEFEKKNQGRSYIRFFRNRNPTNNLY